MSLFRTQKQVNVHFPHFLLSAFKHTKYALRASFDFARSKLLLYSD